MKKVVLGMSGGVDSSVAAILLKEQGYEVIGVTFIFTDDFKTEDAKRVCELLNIKHYIKDYRPEFKKQIIDQFIADYKNGMTPNPCVICNKQIKIKYLMDAMNEYNADFIATGHYAQIIDGRLYKSKNLNKDQSYFLSLLTKAELERILFPLENLEKEEVRKIAEKHGLINSDKKDSFDVCFINNSFQEYMSNHTNSTSGPIVDINTNKIIGTHNGLARYTIGQRKGLNLGGNQERLFVVKKDLEQNILCVANDEIDSYLYSNQALIENVNWISDKKPIECYAKFRYRQEDNFVKLEYLNNNSILVTYSNAIKAVTPGQICVFYDNNECLGGGIIKEVYR